MNTEQEPQAQAEPEVVALYEDAMIASNEAGYVGFDAASTIRSMNEAIARKDAALKAQNEALETAEALLTSMGMKSSDAYQEIDAAITQVKEAMK